MRYFHILSLLKPYPRRISVCQIKDALHNLGADQRGLRTIQRDLAKLSHHFQIEGDDRRPQGWCWSRDASILLPGMDLHTALAFRLMQEFLHPLIPTACLAAAERHFSEAERVLSRDRTRRHLAWLDKVQVVSRGQRLIAPAVSEEVVDAVYQALFADRRLCVSYRRRNGHSIEACLVNPLGLVFVSHSIYLVCTLWEYDDIRQMALHRFDSATVSDMAVREIAGFSLGKYVKERKEFDYPVSDGKIGLVARFTRNAAFHLHETPLSADQRIGELSEEEVLVSATVHDTSQLRWWLLAFGDQVEVLEPLNLRSEMEQTIGAMAMRYSREGGTT